MNKKTYSYPAFFQSMLDVESVEKYLNKKYSDPSTADKRTKILCEYFYEHELIDRLFSYLDNEIIANPSNGLNYLLFARYKEKLSQYDEALHILTLFQERNPHQRFVVQDEMTQLYIKAGYVDSARENIESLAKYLKKKDSLGEPKPGQYMK